MSRLFSGKVILYLFILLILDVCLTPYFGMYRPVLTYLGVLYIAFRAPSEMIPAAILVGVLRDLVSSQPLGTETVALLFVSAGLGYAMQKLEHDFFPMRFAVTALFVFSGMFLNLTLSGFLSSTPQFSWSMILSCVTTSLVSALVTPLFFYGTEKWFGDRGSRGLKQYELFN